MKNKILRIATILAKVFLAMDVLLAGILLFLMISWAFGAGFFESISVEHDASIFKFNTKPALEGIPLSEYGSIQFYFICLQALVLTVLSFLIIQLSIKVINSIKSLETFRMENVNSFQKMGKLFMVWFFVDIPSIVQNAYTTSFSAELGLKYIVFAIICFVLAEIFSEGNKLMEDSKLTI